MRRDYVSDVLGFVDDLIADYAGRYGKVSVTSGAIYDYNNDGLFEGVNTKTRQTGCYFILFVHGIPDFQSFS